MSNRSELAIKLHDEGFNCCQAVLGAFCEEYGMPRVMALRVAGGMGGGVRCGEICGAASGGAMVVGLKRGHYTPYDAAGKAECGGHTQRFIAAFKAANGCLTCRDLLGDDISVPGVRERLAEAGVLKRVCPGLITSAVQILEEQGY